MTGPSMLSLAAGSLAVNETTPSLSEHTNSPVCKRRSGVYLCADLAKIEGNAPLHLQN